MSLVLCFAALCMHIHRYVYICVCIYIYVYIFKVAMRKQCWEETMDQLTKAESGQWMYWEHIRTTYLEKRLISRQNAQIRRMDQWKHDEKQSKREERLGWKKVTPISNQNGEYGIIFLAEWDESDDLSHQRQYGYHTHTNIYIFNLMASTT